MNGNLESSNRTEQFSLVKAHLAEGYQNTQKVIQFQDVKASTILGLSTLFSALIFGTWKWILEFEIGNGLTIFSELVRLPYVDILAVSGILSILSLIASSACILLCICAVIPRLPNSDAYNPYLLFPICSKSIDVYYKKISNRSEEKAKSQADLLCDEVDRLFQCEALGFEDLSGSLREDYKRQLVQVGGIIFKKIKYVQFGVKALFIQLAVSAVVILLISGFLLFVAHRPQLTPPNSAQATSQPLPNSYPSSWHNPQTESARELRSAF